MTSIRKIYLLTQTHTDLGFTDHYASLRHHHRDIIDRALDICEATQDAPTGAQMRWTCEVTGTTLDYLRHATPKNVDRFLKLHRDGRLAVGALKYHWTPLVSPALAKQTLRDIDTLRTEFGVSIRSAMQCDVNGLAWFWNDLLVAKGVDFLVTQQNPHRGYWGERIPSAWQWQNRSGGAMTVLQAEHYGMGGFLRISDPSRLRRQDLEDILQRHEASHVWPFDFSVLTVTNKANGDNVYPDPDLSNAVATWNANEDIPMEIITLDNLGTLIKARSDDLPTERGEWMDSWSDGVASTPLETAAARSSERLLPMIEALDATDDPAFEEFINALELYDEHTWGAHSAATSPDAPFSVMQRVRKSDHAYSAHALALRIIAVASRKRAATLDGPIEGEPDLDATTDPKSPDEHSYLVTNPSDAPLDVDWPVPFDRGAGPQISIPQAYGTDRFFPGLGQDGWTDQLQDGAPSGEFRIRATLPARAAIVVKPERIDTTGMSAGLGWAETPNGRIEICAKTGGLRHWRDGDGDVVSKTTLAPEVRLLKEEFHRRQIFQAPYWEDSGLPMGWNQSELFEQDTPEVEILTGTIGSDGASAVARVTYTCGISISLKWTLTASSDELRLTAIQHCAAVSRAFSIDWPLKVQGFDQKVLTDTGGGLIDMARGHVPTSSIRWQSVQSGIVLVGGGDTALAIHSPDVPLFQPEGPWTREPHTPLDAASGGSFWAVHTHWDTNFPSRVFDPAPFRLVLRRTSLGQAENVLGQMATNPVIVRVPNTPEGPIDGF